MTTHRVVPKRVLIPIAQGSCEYQTVALATVLGRCGVDVQTACINGDPNNRLVKMLLCTMQANLDFETAVKQEWDGIVLPGGEEGAETMKDCSLLTDMLIQYKNAGKLVAATGFTPSIVFGSIPHFLSPGGTCFPLKQLRDNMPQATDYDVVVQDNIVTCQGIGPCLAFSLVLAELLLVKHKTVSFVASSILVDRTGNKGISYFPPRRPPVQRTKVRTSSGSNGTVSTTTTTKTTMTSKINTSSTVQPSPQQVATALKRAQQTASTSTVPKQQTACRPTSGQKQSPAQSRTDAQAIPPPTPLRMNAAAATPVATRNVQVPKGSNNKRKGRPTHKSVGQASPDQAIGVQVSFQSTDTRTNTTGSNVMCEKRGTGRPRKSMGGATTVQGKRKSVKRRPPSTKSWSAKKRQRKTSTTPKTTTPSAAMKVAARQRNIQLGAVQALKLGLEKWVTAQTAESTVSQVSTGSAPVTATATGGVLDDGENPSLIDVSARDSDAPTRATLSPAKRPRPSRTTTQVPKTVGIDSGNQDSTLTVLEEAMNAASRDRMIESRASEALVRGAVDWVESQLMASESDYVSDLASNSTRQRERNMGKWSDTEHSLFLRGLEQYGRNWKKIATVVKSRNGDQIRHYANKYFEKLAEARQNGHEKDDISATHMMQTSKRRRQTTKGEGSDASKALEPSAGETDEFSSGTLDATGSSDEQTTDKKAPTRDRTTPSVLSPLCTRDSTLRSELVTEDAADTMLGSLSLTNSPNGRSSRTRTRRHSNASHVIELINGGRDDGSAPSDWAARLRADVSGRPTTRDSQSSSSSRDHQPLCEGIVNPNEMAIETSKNTSGEGATGSPKVDSPHTLSPCQSDFTSTVPINMKLGLGSWEEPLPLEDPRLGLVRRKRKLGMVKDPAAYMNEESDVGGKDSTEQTLPGLDPGSPIPVAVSQDDSTATPKDPENSLSPRPVFQLKATVRVYGVEEAPLNAND